MTDPFVDMKNWLAYILITFATFFWGTTFILVKATVAIISVNFFLTLRFAGATILMLPYILYRKQFINLHLWKQGGILGLLLFASYYFQTVGLQFTTPANAAFITGLNIIFIPIFAFFLFRQSVSPHTLLAVALSFVGTLLITINPSNLSLNPGDVLILFTAISIALHILFAERFVEDNIMELLWIQFVVMTLSAIILHSFDEPVQIAWYNNQTVIFTLFVTVIFATIFAFAAQLYAQQVKVSATVIGILFTLEPVFALLIDLLVGTIPTLQGLLGMIAIFAAIVLVTITTNAKKEKIETITTDLG